MTKDEAIKTIETLYPADSEYPDTACVGRSLLKRAKEETKTGEMNHLQL